MEDYKKLYCKMFSAATKALHIIQQAQIECENMYLEMSENKRDEFKVLDMSDYENCKALEFDEEDSDEEYIVFDLESDE